MSYFFEKPQSILGQSSARGEASLGDIFGAAVEQMRLVDTTNAAETALTEAYQRRIAEIEAATGEKLENPMIGVVDYSSPWTYAPGMTLGTIDAASGNRQARIDHFNAELERLAGQHPDARDAIRADVPMRDDALALARQSDEQLATLLDSREGWDKWIVALGGGMTGALGDPMTQGSLLLGAGPSAAKTVGSRILAVATREAAINAGVEAAMQPTIQGWRREAGLDYGLDQALANVGLAGVLGFSFGAALSGAGEGIGALARRRLSPDERDAVARVAADSERVAPDMRAALDGDPAAAVRVLDPVRDALPPSARGALDQMQADQAIVAPARAEAEAAIFQRLDTDVQRPAVIAADAAERANMSAEALALEDGWRVAQARGLTDEIEARWAAGEDETAISANMLSRIGEAEEIAGQALADAELARAVVRSVKEKLELPDHAWDQAFFDWREDYLAREMAPARGEVAPDEQRAPQAGAMGRAATDARQEASMRFDADLGLAQRALEGDARALDDLAARDPDLAARAGREPSYPRDEDIPGPRGLDDPFDEAALNRAIEDLDIDEAMLDMPVPNENGEIVPLRAMLEDADHDAAMSRFVELCSV